MTLPSQNTLKKVSLKIKNIPNRQGEYKRGIHCCCFLLCRKSGLRISEAVKFDLSAKNKQGLYRINKPKGKKERFVYVSPSVISELKKHNWQPNQTNRHNFYHFLHKIKRELNISPEIELTPHTLRRSFTTHHANSGVPLPLLQKLLGHSSIRTTALYWHDTDEDGNHDTPNILQVKKWLENREPPEPSVTENLPEQLPEKSNPVITPKIQNTPTKQNSVISTKKPIQQDNSLPISGEQEKNPVIVNYQPKPPKKILPNISKIIQQPEISQPLVLTTVRKEPPTEKEEILLKRISELEEKLKSAEAMTAQEKKRADNAEQQLKTIAKILYQLQKANYYKQLERERTEIEAKIIQPPPFKIKK